jgi:hypothetical protein
MLQLGKVKDAVYWRQFAACCVKMRTDLFIFPVEKRAQDEAAFK